LDEISQNLLKIEDSFEKRAYFEEQIDHINKILHQKSQT